MSVPSMGFTFMALGAFGDLPSAGAGRFLMPGPETGPDLPDA